MCLPIVSQLQFHPSILFSVVLGLGLHKLHFPDPLDCCIPLDGSWEEENKVHLCLLASPINVDLIIPVDSSLQLFSEGLELSSLHPSEVARAGRW